MAGPKFSRDELVEIVRRHAHVYKDDDGFARQMMDIASFLIEYRAWKNRHDASLDKDASATAAKRRYLLNSDEFEEKIKLELMRNGRNRRANCKLCGAPSLGNVMCPSCGNMAT